LTDSTSHDHDWGVDNKGNWAPGQGYPTPGSYINRNVRVTIGVIGGSYLIYRTARMLPSLAPPLWWTIPINLATQ